MSNMIRNMMRKIKAVWRMLGRSMTRSIRTSDKATIKVRREMRSLWTESSRQRSL